ncbi:MAG: hypothetical protein V4666_01560 [Bacteroidota bacterium]
MKKQILLLLGFCFLFGCNSNKNYEETLMKYENVNFCIFKNVSITFRSSDIGEKVYMISELKGNTRPYIVVFDSNLNTYKINNKFLLESGIKDYFEEVEIINYMKEFMKLKLYKLDCDSNCNVMINPFHPNETVCLLLINKGNKISKDYLKYFKHYKRNWYVLKK